MGLDHQHDDRSDLDPSVCRGGLYLSRDTRQVSNRTAIDAALPKMQQQFTIMDKAVASGHLVGDTFTLADMNFMPILFYMNKFPESSALLAASPNLKAYFERHFARKSVQDAIPQSPPGTADQSERAKVARAVNA